MINISNQKQWDEFVSGVPSTMVEVTINSGNNGIYIKKVPQSVIKINILGESRVCCDDASACYRILTYESSRLDIGNGCVFAVGNSRIWARENVVVSAYESSYILSMGFNANQIWAYNSSTVESDGQDIIYARDSAKITSGKAKGSSVVIYRPLNYVGCCIALNNTKIKKEL
jgi:hypothetical protein